MKTTRTIPAHVLTATATLLQPYLPDVTPDRLKAALCAHDADAVTGAPRALKIREVCERLSCSRATVWRMVSDGRLRRLSLAGGKSARIPEADVLAILEEGGQEE